MMKIAALLAPLLLIPGAFAAGQNLISFSPDSAKSSVTNFRSQTDAWRDAYNSGDILKLAPLYAPDAVYCSAHVPGLVARGRDSVMANFGKGMKLGGHVDSIEILSVESSCTLTTLFCRYEATNDGRKAVGRNLLVLRNENGKWLITVHMTVV